jgi:hypothetical protein
MRSVSLEYIVLPANNVAGAKRKPWGMPGNMQSRAA